MKDFRALGGVIYAQGCSISLLFDDILFKLCIPEGLTEKGNRLFVTFIILL